MMSERPCERCGGTGKVGYRRCPTCLGTGRIRPFFTCPVCNGRYYVPRDPPIRVRCPHCGSLLWTYWNIVEVVIRGTVPVPTPGSRIPLGAIGGGLLGLVLAGPPGAIVGALLGAVTGAAAEGVLEAREE